MPSARRVPDSEVLASSMTGSASLIETRRSRTTLISGSGEGLRADALSMADSSRGSAASGLLRRARHHSKPAMPAMNKTPAMRRMRRSSLMPTSRSGHAHGLVDVYRHESRTARFGHGDSEQLRGQLHGGLVVRDEDELHALRHLLDDVAEAADVVLVERRIHFVQQAERRRVQ